MFAEAESSNIVPSKRAMPRAVVRGWQSSRRLSPALLIMLVIAPGASAFLAPLLTPMGALRASRPTCLLPARIGGGGVAWGAGGEAGGHGVWNLERRGEAGRAGLVQVRGQRDSKADAGERTDWNGERRREEAREKEKLDEKRKRNPEEELDTDSGAPLPPDPGCFSTFTFKNLLQDQHDH